MTRQQADDMAIRHEREKLMRLAKQQEKNGHYKSAGLTRVLAQDLPELMR